MAGSVWRLCIVCLIIITAVFAGVGTFESALVDYLILVVVLVPFVYLFDSIVVVYVHNMQCHVRSCLRVHV